MNPLNHTPGPWAFSLNHSGDYQLRGSNGHLVFQVSTGTIPDNSDARLIASAPQMLMALELGVALVSNIEENDILTEHEREFLEYAREIIAKAKGN